MKRSTLFLLPLILSAAIAPVFPLQAAEPVLLAQASSTMQTASRNGETLYLNRDTTYDYSLRVTSSTNFGGLNIPSGAIVRGRFEPVSGGLRYVATRVEVGDRIISLQATSDTLHDVKDPRETSAGAILGDAGIGAAGGALLGGILGDGVSVGEVLGGAAAGAIVGNVTAQRIVVIEPNQTIILRNQ